MEKDYTNFSSAVKPYFGRIAQVLGYEQVTSTIYVKKRDGWYETFNLQKSHGNSFFYFNYGVILPQEFPSTHEELKNSCWYLGARLEYKEKASFSANTKEIIKKSAEEALSEYQKTVVPLFEKLNLKIIQDAIENGEYELYLYPIKTLIKDRNL
jgi:HD-GYP domain-containing protein (c-di-GMP phosphodiesterase class II)